MVEGFTKRGGFNNNSVVVISATEKWVNNINNPFLGDSILRSCQMIFHAVGSSHCFFFST